VALLHRCNVVVDRLMKITCSERDMLLLDKSGIISDEWAVESSLTDLSGQFGEPFMGTTWGGLNGLRVKDVRHPSATGGKDVEPCEHYQWVVEGVDE
jgi:hypothetical protein